MEKGSPLDKISRVVVAVLAASSVHISTVNNWAGEKPNNWWNFSLERFHRFYTQNSGGEIVGEHWLTLIYLTLFLVPLVPIGLTVRYLATGKFLKGLLASKCCKHCEVDAKSINTQA